MLVYILYIAASIVVVTAIVNIVTPASLVAGLWLDYGFLGTSLVYVILFLLIFVIMANIQIIYKSIKTKAN